MPSATASATARTLGAKKRTGYRSWLRRGQYLIIPCLMFFGLELAARYWVAANPQIGEGNYYYQAELLHETHPPDVIFLGSSRVAAAVDQQQFATELSTLLKRKVTAVNMGMGGAFFGYHYLGIRYLLEKRPHNLTTCLVFIEAPHGLPDAARWEDPWVSNDLIAGNPRAVTSLLRVSDLPKIWGARFELGTKLNLSFQLLATNSVLFDYREAIKYALFYKAGQPVGVDYTYRDPLRRPDQPPAVPASVDLFAAAGIRSDPAGVAFVRREVTAALDKQLRRPLPVTDWEPTILQQVVRLVQQAGGTVVFFDLPVHSLQAAVYQTPPRQLDRQRFAELAQVWGTPILQPKAHYPDEAFPDIAHLGKSRRADFTAKLWQAWVAYRPPKGN